MGENNENTARMAPAPRPFGFDFSLALLHLKQGKKVARSGWNGKGMWIALTPESSIEPNQARTGAAEHLGREIINEEFDNRSPMPSPKRCISIHGHIDMRAADGSLVIGWLASQTDLLVCDWVVVE